MLPYLAILFTFLFTDRTGCLFYDLRVERLCRLEQSGRQEFALHSPRQGLHFCCVRFSAGLQCGTYILVADGHRSGACTTEVPWRNSARVRRIHCLYFKQIKTQLTTLIVFTSWMNHVMHTNIMVFIVIELFTTFRAYPSRRFSIASLAFFSSVYLVWIHIVKHNSGVWVYPVLEVLNLPQRIGFFVAALLITQVLYFAGEFINKLVWRKELAQLNPSRSARKSN